LQTVLVSGRFAKPSYVRSDIERKAAGEVLTAKQAPHRPGTAPALGLRDQGSGTRAVVGSPGLRAGNGRRQ
jgi:hypothetical protein